MSSSFDLYATVTDQIVSMLEKGVVPWRSPILGQSKAGHPRNLTTGKPYRGINSFLLAFSAYAKGYSSSFWVTFKQAKERGGSVRKGEKASTVIFWKSYDTTDRKTGDPKTVPLLRYYNCFNLDQVEGIPAPDAVPFEPTNFTPIQAAEAIAKGYVDGPPVEHIGQKAYYRPSADTVTMPEPTRFVTTEDYYSTLLHELSHSTGHSTRLDRKLDTSPMAFGSPDYGREELVAEMSAAFLCGHAGIRPATIDNSAAYLAGWVKSLKGDKRLVVSAAGAAQKSADWIMGERGSVKTESTDETPA